MKAIQLVRLAEVVEVACQGGTVSFPRGSMLAAPADGKRYLYCFAPVASETPEQDPEEKALELYETFTGREARFSEEIQIPSEWENFGVAKSILYRSDKLNGGGTGKPDLFRHRFPLGNIVQISPENGEWLRIYGPRLVIEDRGIVN